MTADRWLSKGEVSYGPEPGHTSGVMHVKSGSAELRDTDFGSGTIAFDIKLYGHGVTGITFRQHGDNADVFYMRPADDCATSFECIQYMPLHHGSYEWDLFPEYETKAPLNANGWNHVRLVISGRRMNVYINGAVKPTLTVGRLEGNNLSGAIKLHGQADYANLVLSPGKVDGLSPAPVADPTDRDPRYVRAWKVAVVAPMQTMIDPATKDPTGKPPVFADLPPSSAAWRDVATERKGLLNLSRACGSKAPAVVSLAWLKTTIDADQDQQTSVSIGWAREVWVFVNGKLVFADKNTYGAPAMKAPEGRVSPENGSFRLPLHQGRNEVVVALDDNFPGQHFGWGLEFRLADVRGLALSPRP